jgi:hypothetical protein
MPDPNAPLTAAELKAYLESQDDFAFEREIFTHARGFGLKVLHAGLYEDPLSEKFRQFDLRAMKVNGDHRIKLAIECKVFRPTNPLLVSCVPRPRDEAYHEVIVSPSAEVRPVESALYPADEPVGKRVRQVARARDGGFAAANERDLFDKYQQALASSADLITESAVELWARKVTQQLGAVLPVLVVPDGTLWRALYSSRGSLDRDPEQASEVTFFLGRRYPIQSDPNRAFTITHLHIMTKTAVTDLLRQIGQPRPDGIWRLLFEPW